MSKSNTRIPFKTPKNKKSPYNFNEIDVNLLLQNPTHIHKLMGKDCDNDDSDIDEDYKYMSKNKDEDDESAHASKLNYGKKVKPNKFGKALNKGVDNFQGMVISGFKKGKNLGEDLINDVKKDGLGNTVRSKAQLMDDLIGEFIENNETLDKFEKIGKPGSDIIRKFKTKESLERIAAQAKAYPKQRAEREERLRKWRKNSLEKE